MSRQRRHDRPANGKQVLVNVLGAGLLRRFEIISGNALATFPFKGEHLHLQTGPLRWVLREHELQQVAALDGQTLNGLRDQRRAGYARAAHRAASRARPST